MTEITFGGSNWQKFDYPTDWPKSSALYILTEYPEVYQIETLYMSMCRDAMNNGNFPISWGDTIYLYPIKDFVMNLGR